MMDNEECTMEPTIWECGSKHVHIFHNGMGIEFTDIDEFLEALLIWQEYVLWRKIDSEPTPEHYWEMLNEESKN